MTNFKIGDKVIIKVVGDYVDDYDGPGMIVFVRDTEPKYQVKPEAQKPVFFYTEELTKENL